MQEAPAQSRRQWKEVYQERRQTDERCLGVFNAMLMTQQGRIGRIEEIVKSGYDVKDLMLRLKDDTPGDAGDVLARKYYAAVVLGQIHRTTALEKWTRLQKRQMVRLEEVLCAYDLFVLAGRKGDLSDVDREFDRLAAAIRARVEDWEELSIRRKALEVARYLREHNLVGNPNQEDYHALRNNFISIALFSEPHTSLPLQSVAIYCSVARRLGINARPSNYPTHVHAVIEAPSHLTLDGKIRPITSDPELEVMHIDPWRSENEVPREDLALRLTQMGAAPAQHAFHLGATSTLEIALRTGRNIMNSVQEARELHRGNTRRQQTFPDTEAAWYGMLWSMMILGDNNAQTSLHRRRQCLPYLVDHFQNHFPEDLGMVERIILPMFFNEREFTVLTHLVQNARQGDMNAKAPCHRRKRGNTEEASSLDSVDSADDEDRKDVHYKIGQHFRHKRYGYMGMIFGWDFKCEADPRWISQMRVDDLPGGRGQPFYNIMYVLHMLMLEEKRCVLTFCGRADDKSQRYVAEENIELSEEMPGENLMALAGRYFKRWDAGEKVFVSNVRDEYPDD